ncbi:peptidoglycan editing factor PgeF [Aneurinibacillus sp. REN35]|uniref:peptidoglycan editing factor PgeF n=1 Tax=Aneurinibacillus sp. REN35 TaxID=3237286 RepID=UPI0035286B40
MEPFVMQEQECMLRLADWERRWPNLAAGFSTRKGGVSRDVFDSFNCGLHVGDYADHVIENRRKLAEANGFSYTSFTCADQVHGNGICIVDDSKIGAGRAVHEEAIAQTDGLLTDKANVFLASFYADCVPLLFYAPKQSVVGVAHAGWRGTVAYIGPRMVDRMKERWDVAPEDIHVAIGPSIGACCYEVNDVVADRVREAVQEQAARVLTPADEAGKYMLNLQETNRILLELAGILPEHIEVSHLCTSCRTDLFYSHRKENGKTGRMTAFIALKEG